MIQACSTLAPCRMQQDSVYLVLTGGCCCLSAWCARCVVQELVQQLRDAGFECGVSRDAGRFVCNYTYYKSLQLTNKLQQQLVWRQQQQGALTGAAASTGSSSGDGSVQAATASVSSGVAAEAGVRVGAASTEHGWPCFSLFVHMPSFGVVNQARQREFVLHLLDLVAKWVAGGLQVAAT